MHGRRGLVLAMSVAEIFLLLMFVVWIVARSPSGPLDPRELQKENERLRNTVHKQEQRIADLEAWKIEFERFVRSLGLPVPKTLADFPKNVGGRGGSDLPPCAPGANRLVVVRVADGATELKFVSDLRELNYRDGDVVTGENVEPSLASISRYQQERQCRFHYRLEFKSDSDYRTGRQRFDRVFYPSGEAQLPGAIP